MKRIILRIVLIVLLFIIGAIIVFAPNRLEDVTVELSRIGVEGNSLVDEDNNIVILRGVTIADPYCLDHYDHYFSEKIFEELSNWNINIVRIPIHPGWWQAEKDYAESYLDTIVSWGEKYGFYIILDWHAIGNPLTGEPQNPEWREKGYTVYNSSLQLAESAWVELAKRYGENSWVLFELFNEPASLGGRQQLVDWEKWRDKLTELIDKIRSYAPNTLILVSGWHWTYNLKGFSSYPIERDNIAYVAHVYASHKDPKDWEYSFGFLSNTYPLLVTEWGFSSTVNPTEHYYGTSEDFGHPFLSYMENKNISWVAWCFHPDWLPNMIKNWNFELTEEGRFVKEALIPELNEFPSHMPNPASPVHPSNRSRPE